MATNPTLVVTNPIMLRLFAMGIEEIIGPLGPLVQQLTLSLAIHEFATGIEDADVSAEIKTIAAKNVVNLAGKLAAGR